MLAPAEVRKKALSLYRKYLTAWLADEPFFPQSIPAGAANMKDFNAYMQAVNDLQKDSQQGRGYGYTIETTTRKTRQYGEQSIPKQLVFHTEYDLLRYVGKVREFEQFTADVSCICTSLDELEPWLQENPQTVIKHAGDWDDLLRVCHYFRENPLPGLYIRELPIEVHTKFIEQNTSVFRSLFDALLPAHARRVDEQNFHRRYGLKTPLPWFQMRLLDHALHDRTGLPFTDFALPLSQLEETPLPAGNVLIVENQLTFLTLPPLPDTVGLWGRGFAVHALRDVSWLQDVNLFYWGDIDVQGFAMLSGLRKHLPQTQSLMMDQVTLETFASYVATGTESSITELPHLTLDERATFQQVQSTQQRLEQEHIYHPWACNILARAIG
ncbi:MAG: Wadjet anti-phage system protein JetD domain-containing protein [Chloroflexota bacterium]